MIEVLTTDPELWRSIYATVFGLSIGFAFYALGFARGLRLADQRRAKRRELHKWGNPTMDGQPNA